MKQGFYVGNENQLMGNLEDLAHNVVEEFSKYWDNKITLEQLSKSTGYEINFIHSEFKEFLLK